ncbi:MAG: hypothetical protein R2762_09015 [Bryobacteraceae bacterium]
MNRRNALLTIAGAGWTAATLSAADVPRPAPEFIVDLPNGGKVNLSGYRGKPLMFGFILTT